MKSTPHRNDIPKWMDENLPEELLEFGAKLFVFKVCLRVKDPNTGKARVIKLDMLPDLMCEREGVEDLMEDIPAQYAFWSSIYSELRLNCSLLERALKVQKGKAIREVQTRAKEEGIKFTADQVKIVMEADEEVKNLDEGLARAQMCSGKVYHMVEAMKMKSELARSLYAGKRQERQES